MFAVYPRFWPKAPKTLGICCEERRKGVSCYVNEVIFGPAPEDGAAGCWENRSLSAPSPWLRGRGERLEAESVNLGKWFHPACLWNEASKEPWKDEVRGASWVSEHLEIEEDHPALKTWKSFPHPLPYSLLPSDCCWAVSLYNEQVIRWVKYSLSSVNYYSKLFEPKERVIGTSNP